MKSEKYKSLEKIAFEFQSDVPMPSNAETEKAIISNLLIDENAFIEAADIINSDCFYNQENKAIYQIIESLKKENKPANPILIAQRAKSLGFEDVINTTSLTELNKFHSRINIRVFCEDLYKLWQSRLQITLAFDILKNVKNDGLASQGGLDIIQNYISDAWNTTGTKIHTMHELSQMTIEHLEKAVERGNELTGLNTGFQDLDRAIGGYQKGCLITVAARPSFGKSAFLTQGFRHQSRLGFHPLMVTLEMKEIEVMMRIKSSVTDIENWKIKQANLRGFELQQLKEQMNQYKDWNGTIINKGGADINFIRAIAQRLKLQGKLSSIFIDYLQIMSSLDKGSNRDTQIGNITRGLKQLAMDLDVPVIIGCQTGRGAERRGGEKRTQLQDLRESGSIENDSDIVLSLYLPTRYGFDKDVDGNSNDLGDSMIICDVDILKNRHGGLGTKKFKFHQKYQRYYGIDSIEDSASKTLTPIKQAEVVGDLPF